MRLNELFADGMVLQAGKPVRIFGTGGGSVTVEFAGRKRSETFRAAEWCIEMDAMEYGGPYEMDIDLDGRKKVIRDIYIGDVYILGGQSNMQFKLRESNYPREMYRDNDMIRLFSLERMEGGADGESFLPEDGWVSCRAEKAGDWSCIGYIAATESFSRKERAIGLIECYQGAAAIQAFLPDRVFENGMIWDIPVDRRFDMAYPWNAGHGMLYDYMFKKLIPYSCGCVIWYQGESNDSEEEGIVYDKMLSLMIRAWREDMRDPRMKFIIIQIADYLPRDNEPWRRIQAAQERIAREEDNCVCVISRDVCENDMIHPVSKTALSVRVAEQMLPL